jgi:hypothetical protein
MLLNGGKSVLLLNGFFEEIMPTTFHIFKYSIRNSSFKIFYSILIGMPIAPLTFGLSLARMALNPPHLDG